MQLLLPAVVAFLNVVTVFRMSLHVFLQIALIKCFVVAEVTLEIRFLQVNPAVMLLDVAFPVGTHTASRPLAFVSLPAHVINSGRQITATYLHPDDGTSFQCTAYPSQDDRVA